jgi:pimeloyl-ACP methyl ester carboxylesterase
MAVRTGSQLSRWRDGPATCSCQTPDVIGFSEERFAPVNGLEICYQEMGAPDAEPLLLVMGLGVQMLGWDERFCETLAEQGFCVIRFDNRDVGRSTKFRAAGVPKPADILLRRRSTAAYLLHDMADDAIGLMDHLGIASAHVVGISMGGMIAQTAAIGHPQRVRSLVSIMSTPGDRWWRRLPTWRALGTLVAKSGRGRDAAIEESVHIFRTIGSPAYPMDEARLREIAGASYDRSHSRSGVFRQFQAVVASGDRSRFLRQLRVPATVIHGADDPLVRPSAGLATARAIPGARLRMIPGMGHDLPHELWPTFVEEIAATVARAGYDHPSAGRIAQHV